MLDDSPSPVLHYLRRLVAKQAVVHEADGELLDRFVGQHDEAAFAALVGRHAPMVLGVCRRILHDADGAEDAFQATFLVLVRKASAIGKRESLGSWLYKVAYRTVLRARAQAARRRLREQQVTVDPVCESNHDAIWWELRPLLDEELARLPERYRTALIICYFQGKTKEEAARVLGCPAGTVSSRLARGRDMLRARLARCGVVVSAAGLVAVLAGGTASASAALVEATIRAASAMSLGNAAAAGAIAAPVAALAEGMVRAMVWTKVKLAVTLIGTLAIATAGTSWLAVQGFAQGQPPKTPVEQPGNDKSRANKAPAADEETVEAVIAKQEIQPFNRLTEDMFMVRRMPAKTAEGWMLKQDLDEFLKNGRMLKVSVGKNKPLSNDDVYDPAKDSLRGILKVGEIAKTLKFDPSNLIGPRFVDAGCHVDIEATTRVNTPDGAKSLSQIIVQDVEVFGTNYLVTQPLPPDRVTVRLTRDDALLLGSYQGGETSLSLLVRPVNDDKKYESKPKQMPTTAERLVGLLQQLLHERRSDAQIVEALYLATQMRLPTEGEAKKATERIGAAASREKAFEELLQSLVKAK